MRNNTEWIGIASWEWNEAPHDWFEYIKIGGYELQDFKNSEISLLKKLFRNKTRIPEIFLYTQFTLTNSCWEILHECLSGYNWRSIEVKFTNWYIFRWDLNIVQNRYFDNITSSWFQWEITDSNNEKEYISYADLMQGIHIRILTPDWLSWHVSWRVRNLL